MHSLFQTLESNGIISELDLQKLLTLPKRKLLTLFETVFSTVYEAQYSSREDVDESQILDPFNFMASASIRADSGCLEPLCRVRKLDFLARFSALYANRVILPLPLDSPDRTRRVKAAKDELVRSLVSLFALRPLIEAGIVLPVVMRTAHCKHTVEFADRMQEFVHNVAGWGAKQSLNEFEIEYQRPEDSPSGRSTVYIKGPDDFLEHGGLVAVFDESSSWRAKSWRYDREGKVRLKGTRKLFFVEFIFNAIANDTTFYLAYGQHNRSRLLTDRAGDAYLLNWMNEDSDLQSTSAAMELLSHSLPILADVPLSTVIRIRREERDSFEAYRRAITLLTKDILAERAGLSVEEAKDAFKAKLEPQIEGVRREINAERARQSRRLAVGISAIAASVLMGAWGGLPILVKGAVVGVTAAMGGGTLAKAAGSACEHGPEIRQKNDLYFLLRLIEARN